MIATILSLNGGLLTTILCIDNQYLVTINSQIKLSVCLSVKKNIILIVLLLYLHDTIQKALSLNNDYDNYNTIIYSIQAEM